MTMVSRFKRAHSGLGQVRGHLFIWCNYKEAPQVIVSRARTLFSPLLLLNGFGVIRAQGSARQTLPWQPKP